MRKLKIDYRAIAVFLLLVFALLSAPSHAGVTGVWKKWKGVDPYSGRVTWGGDDQCRVFYKNGQVKYFTDNVQTGAYKWGYQGNALTIWFNDGSYITGPVEFPDNSQMIWHNTSSKSGKKEKTYYWAAPIDILYNFGGDVGGTWTVYSCQPKGGAAQRADWTWTFNRDGTGQFGGKGAKVHLAGNVMTIKYHDGSSTVGTFSIRNKTSMTLSTAKNTYWLQKSGNYSPPAPAYSNNGYSAPPAPPKPRSQSVYGSWRVNNSGTYWTIKSDGTAVINGTVCSFSIGNGRLTMSTFADPRPQHGTYYFSGSTLVMTIGGYTYNLTR